MGEWKPIDEYDKLKEKPKFAIFFVAATPPGRNYLKQMVVLERRFGFREVTHWMPLPDPPKQEDSQ